MWLMVRSLSLWRQSKVIRGGVWKQAIEKVGQ